MNPENPLTDKRDIEHQLQKLLHIGPNDKSKLECAMHIYCQLDTFILRYEDGDDKLTPQDCEIIEQLLEKLPECEERRKECKEISLYLKELGEKLSFHSGYDFYKIDDMLIEAGSVDVNSAIKSLNAFLSRKETPEKEFRQFIGDLLHEENIISSKAKNDIARILRSPDSAFCLIYSHLLPPGSNDQQDLEQFSANDIRKWLEDDATKFYSLVYTEHRKIWIVILDPDVVVTDYCFRSMWCRVDPNDHFIILSSRLSSQERVYAVRRECTRIVEESFGIPQQQEVDNTYFDSEEHNIVPVESADRHSSYMDTQLRKDEDKKRLVSRWVINKLCVPSEASIAIDAGSNTFYYMDEVFRDMKNKGRCPNYNIITNNILILELLNTYRDVPQTDLIKIELVATGYNRQHRAVYQSDYGPSDTYEKFCNAENLNILDSIIGTSSCMIENGNLYMSANARSEKEAKEFFWRLPSRRKIVLLTSSKIGVPKGREKYEVFGIKGLSESSPIILVSAGPQGQAERSRIKKMRELFNSQLFCQNVMKRGFTIHFIVVEEKKTHDETKGAGEKNVEVVSHDVVSPETYKLLENISKCKEKGGEKFRELSRKLRLHVNKLKKAIFELV